LQSFDHKKFYQKGVALMDEYRQQMDGYIEQLTEKYYGEKPISITLLGGGFYGNVFLAELNKEPYKIALKIYLFKNLNKKEEEQLKILSKYACVKMPQVYFTHNADDEISVDALAMEYIDGVNAGNVAGDNTGDDGAIKITAADSEKIANQIVSNLIGYHQVVHKEGFGEINGDHFEKDWRTYYRKRVDGIYKKTADLHTKEKISDCVFGIVKRAYEGFDKIFSQPIESARLIHGDYNTWNILLNKEVTEVAAVIDPFRWYSNIPGEANQLEIQMNNYGI
jgi:serine/threonine protein kinase